MGVTSNRPVPSPVPRRRPTTPEVRARGRALARSAAAWLEGSEGEFRAVFRFVRGLRSEGPCGRVRDWVMCFMAQSGLSDCGRRRMLNGDWAVVARYMALLDPSLVGAPLSFARSEVDHWGLEQVSWMPDLRDADACREWVESCAR